LVAKEFEWGDHDPTVSKKDGVTVKVTEFEPWTRRDFV
tara:strand:+ start:569 stop:682 length:114 start_codon:yes stop_codon:yes gene_type:complete